MYNGIGLKSARGSGTSGHVQKNLAMLDHRPKRVVEVDKKIDVEAKKRARKEIEEHSKRRQAMLKCAQLRAQLEDDGVSEDEIEKKVDDLKQSFLNSVDSSEEDHDIKVKQREGPQEVEDSRELKRDSSSESDTKIRQNPTGNENSTAYAYKPRYKSRPTAR